MKKYYLFFTALMILLLSISQLSISQDSKPRKNIFSSPATLSSVPVTTPGVTDNILTYVVQDFETPDFPPTGWTLESNGSAN
jgi:hypothetical protein